MNASLEIETTTMSIPTFIKVLEWLQTCPTPELDITVKTIYLQKSKSTSCAQTDEVKK